MKTRLLALLETLGDQFWLRPAAIVLLCALTAAATIWFGQSTALGIALSRSAWTYSGGGSGARSLLSTVASTSVGIASTVFSITIAALSLASGQRGPRLLRNFVRDSRNQTALGIFLGTFVYALLVLRTVRTHEDGEAFVPNVAITGAIVLALLCVGTLVWFVHHIATSINVETVVDAVHRDLCRAIDQRTLEDAPPPAGEAAPAAVPVAARTGGYLQAIDAEGLAGWAHEYRTMVALRFRPGDFVPPGVPVAHLSRPSDGAADALGRALTFGRRPAALQDLEYSIRQLTEIAVRALSPGINDPMTAGSVIDHFGDALCRLVPRHLPHGRLVRDGRIALTHPVSDYDGLCDGMFHLIRQNAAGSVFVLVRLMETLVRVAEAERRDDRRAALRRHADLVMADAAETVAEEAGRRDLEARRAAFEALPPAV